MIDLCLRFKMQESSYTERTCIIVAEVAGPSGAIHIVVDSVSEVINIKSSDIEEPPYFGTMVNTEYILMCGKNSGWSQEPSWYRQDARRSGDHDPGVGRIGSN